MQSIRRRGHRPLTHAVLLSLCVALPACIEDIIVSPSDPYPPDVDGGPAPDPVRPPDNEQSVYYDPLTFASTIQVDMDLANCTVSGCHDANSGYGGFVLIRAPSFGSFEMWSNLQFVTSRVNLAVSPFVAQDSPFFHRATDNHAGSVVSDPEALRDWLDAAAARFSDQTDIWGDQDTYGIAIQYDFDIAGCSDAGCHGYPSERPFSLFRTPELRSPEMAANMRAVIALIDLGLPSPEDTEIYIWSTNGHAARVLDEVQRAEMAGWIQDAMDSVRE